ncbi:hypothetical protein [Paracoccus liaowanqingii]
MLDDLPGLIGVSLVASSLGGQSSSTRIAAGLALGAAVMTNHVIATMAVGLGITATVAVELERDRVDQIDAFKRKAREDPAGHSLLLHCRGCRLHPHRDGAGYWGLRGVHPPFLLRRQERPEVSIVHRGLDGEGHVGAADLTTLQLRSGVCLVFIIFPVAARADFVNESLGPHGGRSATAS